MLIQVLIEDSSTHGLPVEHGLCLWIEACGHRFFYDLGQGRLFAENAAHMGISVQDAEFAVVSHGHYDHGGGIPTFLALNEVAPIYIHSAAFSEYYARSEDQVKYIGLPPLRANPRIHATDGIVPISEGITLFSGCRGKEFLSPANHRILKHEAGQLVCDDFCHEQSLLLQEGSNHVLIAGCAHSGILNIMAKAEDILQQPLTHVVAGMHLKGVDDVAFISALAKALQAKPCRYYTGHCIGKEAYQVMQSILGNQMLYLSTGDTICIEAERTPAVNP